MVAAAAQPATVRTNGGCGRNGRVIRAFSAGRPSQVVLRKKRPVTAETAEEVPEPPFAQDPVPRFSLARPDVPWQPRLWRVLSPSFLLVALLLLPMPFLSVTCNSLIADDGKTMITQSGGQALYGGYS